MGNAQLGKEGKAPRLNTSRFIHVFSPCSKNSLVPIFPLQSTRDRSGKAYFQKFVVGNKGLPPTKMVKNRVSGSISSHARRAALCVLRAACRAEPP